MHARWTRAFLCAALASCAPDAPAPRPAATARSPNVLIVLLDTLRPDHLGCYGSLRPTSPRLDALAQRSALFEHAQSAAPLTVASLLTLVSSLYPEVHGVQGALNPGSMSSHVTTLAEVLAAHGYATAAFTEGGYANPQFGLGQGFQTFPAHQDDRDANVSNLPGAGDYVAECLEQMGYVVHRLTGADLTPEKLKGLDAVVRFDHGIAAGTQAACIQRAQALLVFHQQDGGPATGRGPADR